MLEMFQDWRAIKRPARVFFVFCLLTYFWSWGFLVGAGVLALDIVARYREFLYWRGRPFNPYAIHAMRGSYCSRGVAEAVWPGARIVYYTLGYRSYHVLPDGFPVVFLDGRFWRHVIGWRKI